MIVVLGNRSIESFLLPFNDMLEWYFLVPRSIGNEPIFVSKGPDLLVVNISSFESNIRQFLFGWSIRVEVGVNSWNSSLVRSV